MTPDPTVRVQREASGLDTEITADDGVALEDTAQDAGFWYQSTADVTALVVAQGEGPYRIAGVDSVDLVDLDVFTPVVAWYVVVFYELAGEPSRNLALFDGLDLVTDSVAASAELSGFVVPNAGFDAKLGVVALEGEQQASGDSLAFNGMALSDAVNPANNFFNASRSVAGAPLSVAGDLPQLSGAARSLTNVDLDVLDVGALVSPGDTSATIEASSNQDTFLLAVFVTSISTLKPDFVSSTKSVSDINGGGIRPGDELEYRITAINTGSDTAINTVISDPLPAGVSYVPGSLQIVSGPGTGELTDVGGDDQGEFTEADRLVAVRVGAGASATTGGSVAVGESSVIAFRVTVDAGASGTILNQAVITAEGEEGAPSEQTPTDGNGETPGQPPTDVSIDACSSDDDCSAPTPFCDVTASPHTCVECVTSVQCTDEDATDCHFDDSVCTCVDDDDCEDSDGDGLSDGAEEQLGTDPSDADSDDDGVPDGEELAPEEDRDGDGLIGALDPDADNDGLFDGTELGKGCDGAGTASERGHCRSDADMGATVTNPLAADTDGGGVHDGSEDIDLDGAVDRGETDPTAGHEDDDDDVTDRDGDGLSDDLEEQLHSDPRDADSDDDGVPDGEEPNPSSDTDGDGLPNVLDVDSDNDGLFDGTELGKDCDGDDTDASAGHCRADNDAGATTTSPLLADTDGGGVSDGSEDANLNGVIDGDETDPTAGHGDDDDGVDDSDGDGLGDDLEDFLGTDPNDADSDDDGARDGEEPNPSDDHDGDGALNALDPDSDDDGLFDGTELGNDCEDADTDATQDTCVPDEDMGATRTSPLNPDTDFGGVDDGDEDANRNGAVDDDETDPLDRDDDMDDGGMTPPTGPPDGGMMPPGSRDGGSSPDRDAGAFLGGGGCDCRTMGDASTSDPALIAWALMWLARRRRARPD
jgi:clumping factor A